MTLEPTRRQRFCRTIPFLALSTAVAATLGAQQPGITALPDSVVQRVDLGFAPYTAAGSPGCAIGLARNGQPVLTRAYGLANLEYDVPNTPETIFESGSVAKQFTAAAVVLLVQDGKLSLDDDVRKYLPELHDFGNRITIRNLLTHTSGLRDWYTLAELERQPAGMHVHSPATILEIARRQRTLNFPPGAEYLYSNTGYILASIIVQRVSGTPFTTFTEQRLFRPIGLTHTQWRDDFTKVVKGRATAYTGNARTGFTLDMPFTNVIGSGGLLTTVSDWLTWNAFLDDPVAIPGGAALVRMMTTPMILNSRKPITYALGVTVTTRDGMREVSHSGSTGGYRTWLARYPDEKASVAVLCNAGGAANAPAAGTAAVMALLGRSVPPAVGSTASGATPSPTELARYAGLYRGANPEVVTKMIVRDGQLLGPSSRPLTSVAPDRFRAGASDMVFLVANGKVTELLQIVAGDTTVLRPVAQVTPTQRELAAYTGSFASDELDARLRVEVRDSVLVVRQPPAPPIVLRPTFADAFAGAERTFVFTRDKRGAVTGLEIWAGRARDIRFVKAK